jgi:hypothetical protein
MVERPGVEGVVREIKRRTRRKGTYRSGDRAVQSAILDEVACMATQDDSLILQGIVEIITSPFRRKKSPHPSIPKRRLPAIVLPAGMLTMGATGGLAR